MRQSLSPVLLFLAVLVVATGHVSCVEYDDGHRRFEYRHSFKAPGLADKQGQVPCWTYGGSAMASSDQLRLTPSIRSKTGMAWNKFSYDHGWFEVEAIFRVTGRGRVGADGLAMWFTEKQGTEGPVFGSSDYWNGLGVFFDSFDNDGGQNNPYVLMVQNDGTKMYDHNSDGSTQAMGGCIRDFRNRPHPPRVLITYYRNQLTLRIDQGTSAQPSYDVCAYASNIKLPPSGYFGLSAATGGLADDHDVISFKVSSIHDPLSAEQVPVVAATQDSYKQYEDDYEKRSQELDKQKETFYKENPDKKPQYADEWDYEDPTDKKLRLILEAQSEMTEHIRVLKKQLTGQAVAPATGQLPPVPSPAGTASVDPGTSAVLADLQAKLTQIAVEQKASAQKLIEIQTAAGTGGGGGAPGPAGQGQQEVNSLRDDLRVLQASVQSVSRVLESVKETQRSGGAEQGQAASDPSCVSMTSFVVISVIHLAVVIGIAYFIGGMKKAADKKFF